MQLGKDILDKQLLDSEARRCGKVDDLLIEVDETGRPCVAAILTQQGAFSRDLGKAAHRLACWAYRLIGVPSPQPVEVAWGLVQKIDVVVHLSRTRHELGLDKLQLSVGSRIVSKIPGA